MAILDPIHAKVLAARLIPQIDPDFAERLGLSKNQRSVGIFTADNDDATYVSIDEATKMAEVDVVYARSFYAGSKHSSGLLSGEIIAILAGADPAEVQAGMDAAFEYLHKSALWYTANQEGTIAFFPHVIAQCGNYLAKTAGVPVGSSLAYLIAPPLEGLYAIDVALKAAPVRIASYTPPPSETNYMGVIFTGEQSACQAAAQAFQASVLEVATNPIKY